MAQLWDSHCHLQLDPLYKEASTHLEQAAQRGVVGCLVPSYGPEEWSKQEQLLKLGGVMLALGIHPWCVPGRELSKLLEQLDQAFTSYPERWGGRLKAVGEFGLDRSNSKLKECFEHQCQLFARHLYWSNKLSMPVIIHNVQAHGALQELLGEAPPLSGGVLHSYGGPKELIPNYCELKLCFSYSGNLAISSKARESLLHTPAERILFETDGPQGPSLKQSGPLSPAALPEVIKLAAQILDRSQEWCRSIHRENCARVFELEPDK